MSADELLTIYRAPNAALAGIIAAELEEEGISCRVSDENQGGFPGISAIEAVEVMVHANDAERARAIIQEHEKTIDDAADEEGAEKP